jgi:hypothetical protein
VVATICVVYTCRVALVNRTLAHLDLPLSVSVESLELNFPGNIILGGVEVRARADNRTVLHSGRLAWRFGFMQLRSGRLGSLEIETAVLALTAEDIALLQNFRAATHGDDSLHETSTAVKPGGISWDMIRIGALAFSYAGDAHCPKLSGEVGLEAEHLVFSPDSGFETKAIELRINQLNIDAGREAPIRARIASVIVDIQSASRECVHVDRVAIQADSIFADTNALQRKRRPAEQTAYPRGDMPTLRIDSLAMHAAKFMLESPRKFNRQTSARALNVRADGLLINGAEGAIRTLEASLEAAELGSLLPGGVNASAEALSLTASARWGTRTEVAISQAEILAPRIAIDLAATPARAERPEHSPGQAAEQHRVSGLHVSLDGLQTNNAHLEVTGHTTLTKLNADFDLRAGGWRWQDGQLGRLPESLQELRIDQLHAWLAGITRPIHCKKLTVSMIPSIFSERGRIHALKIAELDIDLEGLQEHAAATDAKTHDKAAAPSKASHPSTPSKARPIHADPSRWVFETLEVNRGHITIPAMTALGIPHIETSLALSTPQHPGSAAGVHDLSLSDLSVSAEGDRAPFYRTEGISARVDYREAWRGGGIRSLRIGPGTLEVGEDLTRLVQEFAAKRAALEQPLPDSGGHADEPPLARLLPDLATISIADTRVILKDIAPGIRTVIFGLEKKRGRQRIELEQIEITSPYNPLLPVARLNTIFVEFSLAGLLNKTIDKVEIVNPTIYVGEHLFWFIEHYRTHGTTEEETGAEDSPKSWDIGEIHAHNGRLIVAPKGTPVPGLEVPFPFSCRTRLGRGIVEANLTIQNADYAIPDIEVLLEDLEGTVEFNLPLKRVDNNLVQVLKAQRLRFRQLEGTDPWVSFTYDRHGIYTRFGANAYGGYVEGEANVYIDENYTWDAWASLSEVESGPITEVLTPEYFRMRGRSNATLVANGNIHELFQAKGQFSSPKGGEIDVRALNGLEDNIEVKSPVTRWLAEAGVDLLRHFRYDNADGRFDLYGREGALDFLLAGPDGRREFHVIVHDHRPIEEIQKPGS